MDISANELLLRIATKIRPELKTQNFYHGVLAVRSLIVEMITEQVTLLDSHSDKMEAEAEKAGAKIN